MPLYNWICTKCEYRFEKSISLKEFDTKKIMCPDCGRRCKREITGGSGPHSTWKSWRL